MNVRSIVLFALATAPVVALAQPQVDEVPAATAPISGVVRDRVTGAPVAGVSVYLAETGEVAITDEAGRFELAGATAGTWSVVAIDPSYKRLTIKVVVPASGTAAPLDLQLDSANLRGDEVVVEVERPRTSAGQTTMRREEITRVPGARGDMLQAVKSLPGVAKTEPFGFGSGLVIRGSSPAESRIFVDGFEIPILYHFGGIQSVIPSEMIDDLVYTPGAFGVEYGKASAGIIEVRSRGGARELSGFGEVSFINAAAQSQGPIGDKGDFSLGVRRSYIDAVIGPFIPEDSVSVTTLPRYYDYQGRLQYRPGKHWKLTAFLFGTDDKLALASADEPDDPDQPSSFYNATRFTSGIASATFDNGPVRNRLSLRAGTQLQRFDVGDDKHLRVGSQDLGVRDDGRIALGKRLALIGGGELNHRWVDVDVRFPRPPQEGDPRDPSFDDDPLIVAREKSEATDAAGWAAVEVKPAERITLTGGVRTDYFGRNDKVEVQPRVQSRIGLDETSAVLAAFGVYTRPPDDADENLQTTDLEPERAIQYSLGVEKKFPGGIEVQTTGFYNDRSNMVVFASGDRADAPDGTAMGTYNNDGTGRTWGLEALAKMRTERFFGWIAYTLSRSTRRDHPMDEVRMFDEDQMHNLVVVASWKVGRWQFGGRFQYVTGFPYTPVESATLLSDSNKYEPTFGAVNSQRSGPEHQLDIRIDRAFPFKHWKLSAYLDVTNVYMNAPVVDYDYSYDYSERSAIKGLPILPSFGVRGEF